MTVLQKATKLLVLSDSSSDMQSKKTISEQHVQDSFYIIWHKWSTTTIYTHRRSVLRPILRYYDEDAKPKLSSPFPIILFFLISYTCERNR
jgi:hypothetical protein